MPSLFKIIIFKFFLFTALQLNAQKEIVISDTLAGNSDRLPVKPGIQWMGKMWKMHFGDYAIVSSKRHE